MTFRDRATPPGCRGGRMAASRPLSTCKGLLGESIAAFLSLLVPCPVILWPLSAPENNSFAIRFAGDGVARPVNVIWGCVCSTVADMVSI